MAGCPTCVFNKTKLLANVLHVSKTMFRLMLRYHPQIIKTVYEPVSDDRFNLRKSTKQTKKNTKIKQCEHSILSKCID